VVWVEQTFEEVGSVTEDRDAQGNDSSPAGIPDSDWEDIQRIDDAAKEDPEGYEQYRKDIDAANKEAAAKGEPEV
jgi:hypothetical protein